MKRLIAVAGLFALALVGIAGAQQAKDPVVGGLNDGLGNCVYQVTKSGKIVSCEEKKSTPLLTDLCAVEPTLAPCLLSRIAALEKDRDDLKRRVVELEQGILPGPHDWMSAHNTEKSKAFYIVVQLPNGREYKFDICLIHGETRVLRSKEKP